MKGQPRWQIKGYSVGLELKNGKSDPLKKGPANLANPLFFMVPEARIELARTQGPLDFESSASTNFTTPA